MKSFKDLIVWQKGIYLVKNIYCLSKDLSTYDELYIKRQLNRSALSIPSNIAEGYGRFHTKEYIRFLNIARGSLFELQTQLIISNELKLITGEPYEKVESICIELEKMLNSFIQKLLKSNSN